MNIPADITEIAAKSIIDALLAKFPSLVKIFTNQFSWSDFRDHIEELSAKIEKDVHNRTFSPEVVIGIEGGGIFVGGLLFTNFLKHRGCQQQSQIKYCILNRSNREADGIIYVEFSDCEKGRYAEMLRGMHVLLVDATVYSGSTMHACVDFVKSCGPAEIRTATVYQSESASVTANYFVKKTKSRKLFPWELSHGYKNSYGR